MKRWSYLLERDCAEFLFACAADDQQRLLVGLERLLARPFSSHDAVRHGADGREYRLKWVGDFVVTYWEDFPARKLVVVEIRWS